MTISIRNLKNPNTKQKIRAAMRAAFFQSSHLQQLFTRPVGRRSVLNKKGDPFLRVVHFRNAESPCKGLFVFIDMDGNDLTKMVVAVLRGSNEKKADVPALLRSQAA